MAAPAESSNTRQLFLYFGGLTLLVFLVNPSGYLLDIPTSYMLKNQLHASAAEVSLFRLVTAIPVYAASAFGLIRDLWNPLGLRDRGYFLIFAPITALAFLWMEWSSLSYLGLLAGLLLAMLSFRFSMAAYQGLIALVGQEKLMSGRLSALWLTVWNLISAAGAFGSGYLAEYPSPRNLFFLVAVAAFLIACWGLWKPRAVFHHAYDKPQARGSDFFGDIRRLAKHRAIYPAIFIMLLWSFSPGSSTPLQFYLTNQLHVSDAIFAYYTGVFTISFLPTFFLYGFLCQKLSLRALLWWGTVIAVPQMIPMAFVHSGAIAVLSGIPQGLMGGIATAAYYDLAMRSCPPGLQGTLMMLVDGVYVLAFRGGDVVGSWIYASSPAHGFRNCVITTTAVYALILPLILVVPKQLIATSDGEPNPEVEAAVIAEIGEAGKAG
jgi:Major Facilitator Superfamily